MKTLKIIFAFLSMKIFCIPVIFSQNLIVDEEFNTNTLNTQLWHTQANWGPNYTAKDLEIYLPNNVSINNGTARLTLDYAPGYYNTAPGVSKWFDYTAGSIFSANQYLYGTFEIRCKIPKDCWPAFWLYGSCCQEIDVFEFLDNDETHFKSTVHTCEPGFCNETGGGKEHIVNSIGQSISGSDFSDGFHTFTLVWTPNDISILVDGIMQRTCAINGILSHCLSYWDGGGGWTYLFPNQPMNLIVSVAARDGSPSGFMEIDYIKIWSGRDIANCNVADIYVNGSTASQPLDLSTQRILHSSNFITTSAYMHVTSSTNEPNVYWCAENYIDINPGFSTDDNTTFTAEIAPCNPSVGQPNKNTYKNNLPIASTTTQSIAYNFSIVPNPCNGKFLLSIKNEQISTQKEISIYNAFGQIIYQSTITDLQSQIDLSSHPTGIYFIKVALADKVYYEKVVVQ